MTNILLTCAGRRNYLVRFFKQALGPRGAVIACDCSDSAPALADADRRLLVPPVDAPDYFDALVAACREHAVRLVFCVHDLELAGLVRAAPRFREVGTIPVVAPLPVIATCQDKWAAFRYLRALGIPTPETYPSVAEARAALARGALRFPVLLKPRWGTISIGIERADNDRELALVHAWGQLQLRRTILGRMNQADPDGAFIVQPWLAGQEYGIDVVNDLQGRYVATLARRKLVMRAGNTDRAVTVADPALERLGETLGRHLGHPGTLDCDLMATESGYQVLDLNPRFGGGYPFAHLAGANVPAALIAWARGEQPDPAWFLARPGVVVAKYDGVTVIEPAPRADAPDRPGLLQETTGTSEPQTGVPIVSAPT